MKLLTLITFIASIYVVLECLSVAANADKGERFCIFARYFFCLMGGMMGAHDAFLHLVNGTPISIKYMVFIGALFFSCWSRMVYRLFGNRRKTHTHFG